MKLQETKSGASAVLNRNKQKFIGGGIFISRAPLGLSRCARCHKLFKPKKDGDRYGPRCARKLAGQIQLDSMALISGKALKL